MRTLDPEDWRYRPIYDMSNDTNDYYTAKGFNYHQGPEWVWVLGYFLRAKILFSKDKSLCAHSISNLLTNHKEHLEHSPWQGIAELTNKDGSECHYSCPTQAWSLATLLDAYYDLYVQKLL